MSDKSWEQIRLEQCIFHPEYQKLEKELAEARAENAKLESFVSQLKEMGQEYKDELAEAKAEVEVLREIIDVSRKRGEIQDYVYLKQKMKEGGEQ